MTTNNTYPSGKLFLLSDIKQPQQVVSGEINIFLVKFSNDLESSSRVFLFSVTKNDEFLPCPVIDISKEFQLCLGAVPVGDAVCMPWEAQKDAWLKKVSAAGEQLGEGSITYKTEAELLPAISEKIDLKRRKRVDLDRENKRLTEEILCSKLEKLGSLADITLAKNSETKTDEKADNLLLAIREIAELYKLPLHREGELINSKQKNPRERLTLFAESSGWRMRKIVLAPDYYKYSANPVLVFRKDSSEAPAILFLDSNGSTCIDFSKSSIKKIPLNKNNAGDYSLEGYCFYEPFPAGDRSAKSIIKFLCAKGKPIFVLVLISGLISSVLGMIMPVATQYITSNIIPTANLPELIQLLMLMIVLTACETGIGVVPSLIMTMFSTSQFERFQAALYDHVLRIPISSFKKYESGEMTLRIMSAAKIQSTVFTVITQQFSGSIFSLISLVMMFYYDWRLAMAGMGMVIIYAAVFLLLSKLNIKPLKLQSDAEGRLNGIMKQLFDGMSKIRGAGAEQRLLSRFTDDFGETVRQNYILDENTSWQSIITSIFPMIISVTFYGMAGGFLDKNLPLPIFLAFMAAFQNFQSALMGVAGSIWTIQAIKPDAEELLDILKEDTEDSGKRNSPGKLDGKIELSHVNFRYDPNGPLVLKDVSIKAEPGEFIAVVGPSGAGKSSLVRLLLGFEEPETGAVYYSGKDLANLDLQATRKQMGVIMQNSQIMPGSILDNIITGTNSTLADAWKALEMAAFDKEVEDMPMGIHTPVNFQTISGGQQQRILIARSLIGSPSIIIMDESTSALDNIAQETVKENLQRINATRIVIAHRLSTIVKADKIYVLEKGKIVQEGTYKELIAQEGLFRQLAERQLTDRSVLQ